ncbi:hypothetical protein ACFSHT_05280 [Paraburkholderia silviterrae]|uniref:hypothetical protein n=1 Tax=Paraburkholderia silviterrae TaxID=2528715 RepID=UPI001F0D8405|nr:hypothetical protein [Paraburkholderia silviterrae]
MRKVVGQVIVDVHVREITALAAQRDQRAHLALTLLVLPCHRLDIQRYFDGPGLCLGRAAAGL